MSPISSRVCLRVSELFPIGTKSYIPLLLSYKVHGSFSLSLSLSLSLSFFVILSFISTDKKLYSIFQIFSQVDILFSIGGKYYTGEPITYTYMEDKIFESSRNITIKLHHRVGKYVKLRLHFSDRWIMISEVTFDSGKRTKFLMFEQLCASRRENIGIRGSLSKEQAQETRDPRAMIYRTIFIETFLVPRSEVSSDKTYSTRSTFTHVHIYIHIGLYQRSFPGSEDKNVSQDKNNS